MNDFDSSLIMYKPFSPFPFRSIFLPIASRTYELFMNTGILWWTWLYVVLKGISIPKSWWTKDLKMHIVKQVSNQAQKIITERSTHTHTRIHSRQTCSYSHSYKTVVNTPVARRLLVIYRNKSVWLEETERLNPFSPNPTNTTPG